MHNWKAKKLLALLLSIVMVLGLLPMSALAADTTETAAAPITVTAGGKACTVEKLEDENYTIYRAVFYPEQDITIAPAGSTGTVSLFGPDGSTPIHDADNNPMVNLSSATLPASMITSNALPDDQLAALPGYTELPGGHIAYTYIIVSVNGGAPFALHLATVERPTDVPVTSVTLSSTELTLTVGKTATLTATVGPENATDKTVTWSVDGDAVTVNNGTVTAVKAGTAIVKATSGSATASCKVTVNEAVVETEMEIRTPEDLTAFAAKVSAGNTTLKGILKADIDMSKVTDFVGIGTAENPYAGEFDGGDHTITVSMNIKGNPGTNNCAGIISFAAGANIHNVTMDGTIYSYNNVGLVARTVSGETKIENCINRAAINSNSPAGGIVGEARGTVTVLSCANYGAIGCNDPSSTNVGNEQAGIVGKASAANCVIMYCENHGDLIDRTAVNGSVRVGGIVGEASGSNCLVKQCWNDAAITAYATVGGIVGRAGSGMTIESCYNTGAVDARKITGGQRGVGGILGAADGSTNVTVKDVYNTGKITAFGSQTASGVGGVIGYLNRNGSLTNAYNAGKVSVTGTTPHGSVLGYAYQNSFTLSNCYWLEGTDTAMFSGKYVAITGVDTPASTSDALKALYTDLGDGFKKDAGNVNQGYPVLKWQVSEAPDPVITGIKITNAPTKTVYEAGENFDPTGMTVVAVYDNGNEVEITDYTVEGGENLTVDTKTVTVKYTVDGQTFTATQAITVNAPETEMEIYTAADLVSFANKVKAGKTTLKGILMANIDMTGVTDFVGIGTETNPYAGEFVGNDHTVTVNINITNGNFGTNYCTGLFAFVSGAYIHDVTLGGSVYSYNSVGLVGRVASGDAETKVENCTNEATLVSGNGPLGGIVGRADGKVTVLSCVNNGTLGDTTWTGSDHGGIAGKLSGAESRIEGCANHGKLIMPAVGSGTNNVGGIVGTVSAKNCTVIRCFNDADAIGSNKVGGIVGEAYDGLTVESCYNTGNITAQYTNSGQQGVAGILGTAAYKNNVVIKNVYNVGKIFDFGSGSIAAGAGGIVGYVNRPSSITNAYNAGTVSVNGMTKHGSILGYSLKNDCTISNCYWLTGTDEKMYSGTEVALPGTDTPASTSDALKALYTTLGDGFKKDAGSVNGGYPVLSWQESVGAPEIVSIKITHAPSKTVYTAGESFSQTGMTVAAVYDNDTEAAITDFTVENGENLTAGTASVTVKSGAFTAEQPITVLPASSAYELRVLTFEDADYKGGTNFAGGTDWSSLIDDPQYGGKLLYGESGAGVDSEEKAYTWTDTDNTELTSRLCHGYGSWCYWSGGHAVSNYATGDIADYGGHTTQLTVYKKGVSGLTRTGGGHNGSDNFAVHYGYMDGSQYNMTEVLPSISFADGVSRIIDSMYVTNTTYALNCYIDGNGLTAKIGPDDWVKLVATGYDDAGVKTGETSIYLCNGPDDIVMDWTKFDLSVLGKVQKVEFNVTGSSDNGYGFSQPAYFAYDDVVVRFEKTPTTGLLGDVNNDGDITLGDAVLLYAYVRGKTDLTADQLSRCDLNNDGTVSLGDAVLLYAYVRGKITSFTQN